MGEIMKKKVIVRSLAYPLAAYAMITAGTTIVLADEVEAEDSNSNDIVVETIDETSSDSSAATLEADIQDNEEVVEEETNQEEEDKTDTTTSTVEATEDVGTIVRMDSPVVYNDTQTESVAKIGNIEYASFDDAVNAANDGDTITLLKDVTSSGFDLDKNLIVYGGDDKIKYTVTFGNKGMTVASGKTLTLKETEFIFDGNIKTLAGSTYAIVLASNSTLELEASKLIINQNNSNNGGFYVNGGSTFTASKGSYVGITYCTFNAFEWNGGNDSPIINISDSKMDLEYNRSGFAGTFIINIDHSEVSVDHNRGNGSNGSHYTITNGSEVTFSGNGSHGLSAGTLTVSDSKVTAENNGMMGIYSSSLTSFTNSDIVSQNNGRNGLRADGNFSSDNSSVAIINNGWYASNDTYAGMELRGETNKFVNNSHITINGNGGNGLRTTNVDGTTTFDDTVSLSITANSSGSGDNGHGGGIHNKGTMILPKGAIIYGNSASVAGDDIYSIGTIVVPAVGDDWWLDNLLIDGWYDDSENARWFVDNQDVEGDHIVAEKPGTYTGKIAFKAAYDRIVDIVVNFVDENGNPIQDSMSLRYVIDDTDHLPTYDQSAYFGQDIGVYAALLNEYGDHIYEGDALTGTVNGDKEITFYYHSPVEVVIHYIEKDTGKTLKESWKSGYIKYNSNYDYTTIALLDIDGYTIYEVIGDDVTGIADGSKEITVVYEAVEEPEDQPEKKDNEAFEQQPVVSNGVQTSAMMGLQPLLTTLTLSGIGTVLLRKRKED